MTNTKKTPVYFIATKYKNNPAKVAFFTKKEGKEVPKEAVKKELTKTGVQLYTQIAI